MALFSVSAFSQIEIVNNFDNLANNGVPASWTSSGFAAQSNFICSGTGKSMSSAINSGGNPATLSSQTYSAISNGTEVSVNFDYNIFERIFGFPPIFNAPPSGWSLNLEYSTDGGTSWTPAISLSDGDFTFVNSSTCASTNTTIPAGTIANGADFKIRFIATNNTAVNLNFIIDNLSITQVATTVPQCNSTLVSPTNGAVNIPIDVTLSWQTATGLATGYNVMVGTTAGASDVVNTTTTETSFNLSGLSYSQLHYVRIVPFNSFGNATSGCIEKSFTTRTQPIAGASCDTAFEVLTFPYVSTNNTDNFENNFSTSPCSNSYMNGKDVFYKIQPTEDISIDITMINTASTNGTSVHVIKDCPNISTECVAFVGTFAAVDRELLNVVLQAGNTYYIVLSNSSANRNYPYTLVIAKDSCVNPEMTLTAVEDCANGQFNIQADITYLGSASSLTLTDGLGGSITNINTTGVVTIGPYPSGSTVDLVLTNDQDSTCEINASSFYYCPPSNDNCSSPIALNINTDNSCTLFTSATNAGATHSAESGTQCNQTSSNDVWFSFVAVSENLVIEYLNITEAIGSGGTIQKTEILEGSCGALTSLVCKSGNYIYISDLTVGATYFLRNFTNLGTSYAQNYDICLKAPILPTNDECSSAITLTLSTDNSCNNATSGTTVSASTSSESGCPNTTFSFYGDVWYEYIPTVSGTYEFELSIQTGTAATFYYLYSGECGSLTDISSSCSIGQTNTQIVTLTAGTKYYVMVRSAQTEPGVGFTICVTKLPDPVSNDSCTTPNVLTESTDSNGNNAIVGDLNNSYPSVENCNANNNAIWYSFTPTYTGTYHFSFQQTSGTPYFAFFTGDCSDLSQSITGMTSCFLTGQKTGNLTAGTTYLISVHAATNTAAFQLFAYPDASLSATNIEALQSFTYYPNPVLNNLSIDAKYAISKVSIHSLIGQLVNVITPNNLSTTIDMNNLESGVYFVTVEINNTKETFKVIKK